MEYMEIGILVNSHALKGEVRIISDFEYKDKVFITGNTLYIGDAYEKVTIKTYRKHKNYDMCLFNEYNYINDILKFKGKKVYIDKKTLNLKENEYLDLDLIGLTVFFNNKEIGKITNIEKMSINKLLVVNNKLIPYNKEFIEKIDLNKQEIILKNVGDLI